MKTFLASCLLLLIAPRPAFSQATVQFHITDAFGRSLQLRKVALTPVQNLYPATNSLGQITGDFLTFNTDNNANATVTNVIAGTYRQVVFGPTANTTNYLLIPSTTNTISAKDYVTLYPTGIGLIMWEEAGVLGGYISFEP